MIFWIDNNSKMTGLNVDFWAYIMTQQKMHFYTIPKRVRLIGIHCCGCSSRKLNYNLVTWGNIIKRSNLHVSEPHAEMIESWKKKLTLPYIWCCNQEKEYVILAKKVICTNHDIRGQRFLLLFEPQWIIESFEKLHV